MINIVFYVYIWHKCYIIPARSIFWRIFSFSSMKRPSVAFWSPIRQRWYIMMAISTSTTTMKVAAVATLKISVRSIRIIDLISFAKLAIFQKTTVPQ